MQFLDKLKKLRGMVDVVERKQKQIGGFWHVQIQAGYPPTPFPRWQAKDQDINKAYDQALDQALFYWLATRTGYSCNHGDDMVTVPRYQLDDA